MTCEGFTAAARTEFLKWADYSRNCMDLGMVMISTLFARDRDSGCPTGGHAYRQGLFSGYFAPDAGLDQ